MHNNKKSALRSRLINSFDYFFETKGISDKEVALQAREDKIDIAIDLNGYTQNARPGIFAYRAAPIQINYLGYPGTLGAEFMDYIVADKYLIPPDTEKYFNEKKLYLPNTYMPTDDGREISTKEISRSEMGLPEDAFVFCCFNNNYKITSSEFDIWMRLLKKVDKSVLWLRQSNQFSHVNIKNAEINLKNLRNKIDNFDDINLTAEKELNELESKINDILIEEGHAYDYHGGKKKDFKNEAKEEKAKQENDPKAI